MRYFSHLPKELFYKTPIEITKDHDKSYIAYSLGALLYMPATREDIAAVITSHKYPLLQTIAICLEDAIADEEVEKAETMLQQLLVEIKGRQELPFIFIRVRSVSQFNKLQDMFITHADCITGFIFPKFSSSNANDYLSNLAKINRYVEMPFYAMPILESVQVLYKEQRMQELMALKKILDNYYDWILNVRLGATDLCGLYGLRRSGQTPIYDIVIVRELITDVLNIFARTIKEYVVSGVVWEYFDKQNEPTFIQEILLDRVNGIVGKTIIHPSHLVIVQALQSVSYEEYKDAKAILQQTAQENGVFKSIFSNKMNETKPHSKWAQKIMIRSEIYGVLAYGKTYQDIIQTSI